MESDLKAKRNTWGEKTVKLAQIEEELHRMVKEIFSRTVPRYYEHTLKVVANMKDAMKEIDDQEDKTILLLTAYLHDIGYSVAYRGDYVGNIDSQSLKTRLHSDVGVNVAEEILKTIGMEPEIIKKVSYLVSVHHREDIEDRYLKVLLQADKVWTPNRSLEAKPTRMGGGQEEVG